MEGLHARINGALESRKAKGALRKLRIPVSTACDFSSNDYLGFCTNYKYQQFVAKYITSHPRAPSSTGSTGSRLLSGHSRRVELFESTAATFHCAQTALLMNSGYDANLSLLSSVPGPQDAIIHDELIHASVHDGMRMSRARNNLFAFRHNDVRSMTANVRKAVSQHPGSVIVCVESVYSMDGDLAPLVDLLNSLCALEKQLSREMYLIVDEAHSGGLYGPNGAGLCVHHKIQNHPNLLARVVTHGKAFAAHGAVILGSATLKLYLVNYARPFIYSTALPPHSVAVLQAVYTFMKSLEAHKARRRVWSLVDHFYTYASTRLPSDCILHHKVKTPIEGIAIPGNTQCVRVANKLLKKGFDVYPIRSPTVPRGMERIRIIIHAHNTEGEIERLVTAIAQTLENEKARPKL